MKVRKLWDMVGQTPLIRINSLSEMTGCEIWGKAEFMNPGGSVKDRAAQQIILEAENSGLLTPGAGIVEGTAGNTGIGLATLGVSRGYKVVIFMPNNQAKEKAITLRSLGAEVIEVPPCPFSNSAHFYHQAKAYADTHQNFFWANQFENLANFQAHYSHTGREIWEQLSGLVDVFTCAVGTGGTLGGVSTFLKERNPKAQIILADPMGSGLFSFVKNGVLQSSGSSVTEGIGIMRITANFSRAKIDDAMQISDQEMINMLYFLAKTEGLILGTSAALNLVSAYKIAKQNQGSKKVIATILCDSGLRYQSKIFNPEWLKTAGLDPQPLVP